MVLKEFNKTVGNWFTESIGKPTEVQVKAWPKIKKGNNVLIAAPTGSGKTLAAFFSIIDDLAQKAIQGSLPKETSVVYVSPLKALSNDIERNLQIPLNGVKCELEKAGSPEINITVGLRTGDTTPYQRTNMLKNPPHILVSTPESLYLLLTSKGGRRMLSTVETLIIDEIHALVGDKRGSHLSLSMERLEYLAGHPIKRIGLSATQKPIEKIARFLVGNNGKVNIDKHCAIIDIGHKRNLDLDIEIPRSPLSPVMANEVWEEVYEKLVSLINAHTTTLIFVNTRRLAERMAHNLTNRLGEEKVTAHHGSMSKENRLDAEQRLKAGTLKVLVATASLELGIDIGSVDLVCQIGSPRSIATFLQRVGRSGHSIKGTPKGRIFPLSRDELVECAAIFDAIRRGELDEIIIPEKPLDILSQQIVAELATREYSENELFSLIKKAYSYRNLSREEFDQVIDMLSSGYTTRRGRRGAYIHHDVINGKLRAKKGAGLTALVSGGAIPDSFDYDVMMEPTNTFVGTLNEDFAIESMPGDIFQLGNSSYRILRIESGKVRVEDARGAPPSIPFWFGEAPGRTRELSHAVSRLREEISDKIGNLENIKKIDDLAEGSNIDEAWKKAPIAWLKEELGLNPDVSDQLVTYLAAGKAALGVMPTRDTLVMERFFDEAGDMHLVIHSPFGSRMNRAWGLSLRKRFCRKFNFELQAAATENNIILSLGATHSFPIEEVYKYLNPKTVRNILVQALLDAPMFQVRWRWNASRALAILRRWGGKKVPPQIQRSQSEDLIALIFPDQLACFENIVGEREIPDHPLVNQTIHDCLTEAMDIDELEQMLTQIKEGKKKLIARDLREPSPMAHEILNANPYAFLDPAPLEERRTNAVRNRGWMDPAEAKELGFLDPKAIALVKEEAWPMVREPDELHDAMILMGYLSDEEIRNQKNPNDWESLLQTLIEEGRVSGLTLSNSITYWVPAERISQMKVIYPEADWSSELKLPDRLTNKTWTEEEAIIELIRGRLEVTGPVSSTELADNCSLPIVRVEQALMALENDGFVFRGHFSKKTDDNQWCERRLLARIHRYTLQKLRKEVEPVSSSDFMRFLFTWHDLSSDQKPEGTDALSNIISKLEGFQAPAASWESEILPARMNNYDFLWLDNLCLSGRVTWCKLKVNGEHQSSPIKTTPIAILERKNSSKWQTLLSKDGQEIVLSGNAKKIFQILKDSGANFYHDLVTEAGILDVQAEEAISELVAKGLLTSDSFSGLRALLVPAKYRSGNSRRRKKATFTMDQAGRWTLLEIPDAKGESKDNYEFFSKIYLKRYGVVFRKVLEREPSSPPWRELVRVYRRLEARGEVRGGRFVEGVWGEQFALPEALALLRKVRKEEKTGALVSISASDPLNLTGIITSETRVPAFLKNRILYRDGEPVAVKNGTEIGFLKKFEKKEKWELHTKLIRRNIPPKLRAYLGKGIS